MSNSSTGLNHAWDIVINKTAAQDADLARRRKEDFDFMVLCSSKNDMAMYQLFRDRSLDKKAST